MNDTDGLNGRIEFMPGKVGGEACVGGTRLKVKSLLALMNDRGWDDEQMTKFYPELTSADLDAVRWFARTFRVQRRRQTA